MSTWLLRSSASVRQADADMARRIAAVIANVLLGRFLNDTFVQLGEIEVGEFLKGGKFAV